MITQKAQVISEQNGQVWLEAERKSTCSSCSVKKACGTGMMSDHVGKRFSKIAIVTDRQLENGQSVEINIPEQALLSGAVQMYLLPLLMLFAGAILTRLAGGGPVLESIAGFIGLFAGFIWIKKHQNNNRFASQITITEDLK